MWSLLISSIAMALLLIVLPFANAIPWPGPSPTLAGAFAGLKRSAAPTPAPRQRPGDHLFRRASTDFYKICGSNVGEDGGTSALTCDDDTFSCFSDASIRAIGCCRSSNAAYSQCKMHTSCVNENQTCLDACISDPLLKKCYSPTPSCGTWIWENKYTSFECDTVTFEVRVLSPLEQTLPARAPGSRTGGSAAAASRLVTRTISGVTVVSTISTAQSTTGTTSSSSNNSNSNVAPIAGGAVGGGIFLIAVVVGLWWFFCRKKRGQPKSTSVAEIDSNAIARNEMDANIDSKPKVYSEQQSRYQKDVAPAEMPTTSEMAELPGGSEAETWNNREVMEIRNMDPRGINFSRPVSRPAGHSR